MSFIEKVEETINRDYNEQITENGAVGYATTGKKLLDMSFAVASFRKESEDKICQSFIGAYYENPVLAVKWLFYASDVRGGLGERRLFRVIMKYLAEEHTDIALAVLDLIPEYSRWDNLIILLECNNDIIANRVLEIICEQLCVDLKVIRSKSGQPISLLGKWMPSINASSKDTKRRGKILADYLKLTERQYRKMLSELRNYLDVVERKMSAGQWDKINYSSVPSRSNLIYNKAFFAHDSERRLAFLESLKKGETKINAGVLYPHDILHKYNKNDEYCFSYDATLEQLWKSLKDTGEIKDTLVVADGSGSMLSPISNKAKVSALEVANGFAIYCSERCNGAFKDKYITFSENPQLVDFSNAKTLHDKMEIARHYNEVADTNIEAVFDLILNTAIDNHMTQNEIPKNILIISDMEFNQCACDNNNNYSFYHTTPQINKKLFEVISAKYKEYGYKLPRLIFWNVASRTEAIPMSQNEFGVALVSGFSTNIMSMVFNGELDPYKALVAELNKPRYNAVEMSLKESIV